MNQNKRMIVAVDGYSSTGKSTLARDIARYFRIKYIDSGAMYRAITLYALREGLYDRANATINEKALRKALEHLTLDFELDTDSGQQAILLNGEDVEREIRQMEVSQWVSSVSQYRFIREKLVEKQRAFARTDSLVMDGRDIGTVVFPQADVKIFMTASLEVRTQRRFKELQEKGQHVSLEEVRHNVAERDRIDQNRSESPLRKAPDAEVIDNSHLSRQEQLQQAIDMIVKKMGDHPLLAP